MQNASPAIDLPSPSSPTKNSGEDKRKEIADTIIREFEAEYTRRGNFNQHCQEIAQIILPSQYKLFLSKGQNQTTGEKRTEYLFDSTGAINLGRFASVLESYLTPSNQIWQRIKPSNPLLLKDRQSKLWFEESNRVLFKYRYAPKANFSAQNQEVYEALGAFGNGAMYVDRLDGAPGLRYKACHLSQIYFKQNHQGIVDTVFRHFPLTARQAAQKFGKSCPEQIAAMLKTDPEREFFFIHKICPRSDWDPMRLDYMGKPFAAYYVNVETRALLKEEGFTSFPYAVSRYRQTTGENEGRGPACDVLPTLKTLNEMKKTLLKQGHKAVDPTLLAHDDGVLDGANLAPGGVNWGGVNADGRALVHALPVGNLAIGKELMDDERGDVKDSFLITLFQILVDNPQQTATEVVERAKEKGILIAPTMGRQQSEYLGPMTERELDVLSQQGLLPPMPPALREARGEYELEYDSPLTQARRAGEASGLMRSVESTLSIVNVTQDPAPLDYYDWDVIVPEVAEIQGVPTRWMKAKETVEQIRAGRAQAAQTQEQIQAAPAAAALIKADAATKGKGR